MPWPLLIFVACEATRCMTILTGVTLPTETSNEVDCGCQPALDSVTECLPGSRSSTYTGVGPTYVPSSHADAVPGRLVTNAPPCGGNVAAGCGRGLADGTGDGVIHSTNTKERSVHCTAIRHRSRTRVGALGAPEAAAFCVSKSASP